MMQKRLLKLGLFAGLVCGGAAALANALEPDTLQRVAHASDTFISTWVRPNTILGDQRLDPIVVTECRSCWARERAIAEARQRAAREAAKQEEARVRRERSMKEHLIDECVKTRDQALAQCGKLNDGLSRDAASQEAQCRTGQQRRCQSGSRQQQIGECLAQGNIFDKDIRDSCLNNIRFGGGSNTAKQQAYAQCHATYARRQNQTSRICQGQEDAQMSIQEICIDRARHNCESVKEQSQARKAKLVASCIEKADKDAAWCLGNSRGKS